ncbi:MAG: ribose 5-phosphate isomerase B [Deltaproteobacteria bacterium]|nr:ribose 5-phosphate isomerase B [Deltaproteobacteria bacterium]
MNDNSKRVIIGSDHAAFQMKTRIKAFLEEQGLFVEDVGPAGEASVDYPDFGRIVASSISRGDFERGILMCGTGIGMSMVANRFPHVRAALCGDIFAARMSRLHNDANILVMGGRVIGDDLAVEIVRTWLETPFEGGRHSLRLEKFDVVDAV